MSNSAIAAALLQVLDPAPGARTPVADIHRAVCRLVPFRVPVRFSPLKDTLRAAGVPLTNDPDTRETLAIDVRLTTTQKEA